MNPVYTNGVMSPPPSKQASMASESSNGNQMYGSTQSRSASAMSPSQAQLAEYHHGYQVASPQPIPPSPYPVPTARNTQIEDPEYQEYLEEKRRKRLAMAAEQQQAQQYPPQHLPQHQEQSWGQEPPWVQQQNWQMQQQQQQYRSASSPPQPYPLPQHLQQRPGSAYASMDDIPQQYPQYQQQYAPPQPYVHAIRPGHTYGKITARGNAKIMMGNGTSGKAAGFDRQHNYGEVDIQDDVQIKAGDFGAAEINTFFQRQREV